MKQDKEKTSIITPSIYRLARKLKKYWGLIFIAIVFSITSSLILALVPSKLSAITDIIGRAIVSKDKVDLEAIKNIAITLTILCLIAITVLYSQTFILATVSNRFAEKLRMETSEKINRLPLKYFDKNTVGDILSRVTNDIDTIAQSLNQSIGWMLNSVALVVGTLILMFLSNWILAITAILSSLLGMAIALYVVKKSQEYYRIKQKALGQINGHVEEIYSGLNVVKTYNGQEESDKVFHKYNEKLFRAVRKSQFLSNTVMPLMNLTASFGFLAVSIVGSLLVIKQEITFGKVVEFIMYARMFSNPVSQIANSINALQSTSAASERVFEFFDQEEMPDESHKKELIEPDEIVGNVLFDDVSFTYPGNDKPTISDFSLDVSPGQKIAIVGPTGAGKTTLVNLLMRFYEFEKGRILIDGIDIKEITRENAHDLFTMVLQDTWLFEASIYDNIVYNRQGVSEEEVIEICKSIGIHHYIMTLPNAYDTIVTEEDISAGQRQLITIARGMVKNAPLLILDEATSNVDTRTEKLVQDAMKKLASGKTSFIIAHRLSTIKNSDKILFMKDGSIAEQGSHEELMLKKSQYYELYQSQFVH